MAGKPAQIFWAGKGHHRVSSVTGSDGSERFPDPQDDRELPDATTVFEDTAQQMIQDIRSFASK